MVRKLAVAGVVAVMAVTGLCVFGSCDDGTQSEGCPSGLTAYRISAPDTGATLHVGRAYAISWCPPSNPANGTILKLSKDGGDVYGPSLTDGAIPKGTNTYSFVPADTQIGSDCVLKAYEYNNEDNTVTVVGRFTIVNP